VTTEVLGLQIALARNSVELTLDLRRLRNEMMTAGLLFPDEVSALTLKGSQMNSVHEQGARGTARASR
jgi:hypothetical protein